MSDPEADAFPSIALSHFELFVADVATMESFYSRFLGFRVTDRGKGEQGMVFMSRNPDEHHQLVLNPSTFDRPVNSPVDHISFRVASLADLRRFHRSLSSGPAEPQTVSHGTTWSITSATLRATESSCSPIRPGTSTSRAASRSTSRWTMPR